MKLYYTPGACSLAVRIIINEIGLASEYEAVDLKTKKTESGKDFLTINPKGCVPALLTNTNELLTENNVIQQYLADTAHASNLLPAVGDFNRYRVLEWSNYVSTELHKGCSPLFNSAIPAELKQTVFIPALKSRLTFVNKQLGRTIYLNGGQCTLPDAYLFVVLTWLRHFKISLTEWQHIARFFTTMLGRDAVKKSLKEEGIALNEMAV